jgi:hypothetical protein
VLRRGKIEDDQKRVKVETQEKMALRLETLACNRIAKLVEESKQRCDFAEEFGSLKRIHTQTIERFMQGQTDGRELVHVENFVTDTVRKLKASRELQSEIESLKAERRQVTKEIQWIKDVNNGECKANPLPHHS